MDPDIIAKLGNYCDQLLGESPKVKQDDSKPRTDISKKAKKSEKKIKLDATNFEAELEISPRKKKLKKKDSEDKGSCEQTEGFSENNVTSENSKPLPNSVIGNPADKRLNNESLERPSETSSKVTDDGFKIISSIPRDDSDVSDAFESEGEEDSWSTSAATRSQQDVKTTEDGFKIITDIPPDDSDVSDAFSDGEECDDACDKLLVQRKQLGSSKTLGKPILQMIDEFGLGKDILEKKQQGENKDVEDAVKRVYGVRKSRKRKKKSKVIPTNTTTLASKGKPQVDVTVFDYTKQHIPKDKRTTELTFKDGDDFSSLSKEVIDKEMKKIRFEIFKLGMGGFDKAKKMETRVDLAVSLGARPPKGDYKRKKAEEKLAEQRQRDKDMGIKKKRKPKEDPKKKKPRVFSAQVGRYKDGVLSISKKEISKINASR